MDTKPRHRWFRFAFGLRTLFITVGVAGIALAWLNWQLQAVRERKAVRQEITSVFGKDSGFLVLETLEHDGTSQFFLGNDDHEYARISIFRRLLGDETCVRIFFPSLGHERESHPLIRRTEHAFPEAELISRDPTCA